MNAVAEPGHNRESFMALFSNLSDSEQRRIKWAYSISKGEHHWQTRKQGGRYFEHPRRVALILHELGLCDSSLICAALLHDVVEDTKYFDTEDVRMIFGGYTYLLVDAVTKRPDEGAAYYERLRDSEDPFVLFLKGADTLDNLRSLGQNEKPFIVRQLSKAQGYVEPLLALLCVWSYGGRYEQAARSLYRLVVDQINRQRLALH